MRTTMSDLSQGGTPGVDPAGIPKEFFVQATPKVETPQPAEQVNVTVPAGTDLIIGAKLVEGEGISFVVAALPGSKIKNVDLANALHALSHQIGEAAEKSEAEAKAAAGDSGE